MVVIPNSVASKAIITNHSRPTGPHRCVVGLKIDLAISPSRVIEALQAAATGSKDLVHGTIPHAYARAFSDSLMECELAFAIESFALSPGAKSEMLGRIADSFRNLCIQIGSPALDVRIVQPGVLAVATDVPPSVAPSQLSESL
jgi:small-conductance mechanosensitive channel